MQQLSEALTRIENLERANRRMRRIAATLTTLFLLAIVTPLVTAFSPASTSADTLRGEALELVGADGEVYASLRQDSSGHPILLMRKDKSHAVLTTNGPALHLRAADGRRGVFTGFDTQGVAKVELADAELTGRVGLHLTPDDAPGVYLFDEQGFKRTALEYLGQGASMLSIRGDKGQIRSTLGLDTAGNASTLFLDTNGRRRVGILVQPDGTPLFSMEDEQRRPRMNVTMDFDGATHLEFLREDGRPSHTFP